MSTRSVLVKAVTESTENIVLQVPRALVASGLAAMLDFGILVLLVEKFGWSAVPAAVVGYLSGGVIQYVLCSVWVFPAAPQNHSFGISLFIFLSLIGLGITWVTMSVFHEWAHWDYVLSKCVALGLAFSWNFLSRKYWLFRATLQECAG